MAIDNTLSNRTAAGNVQASVGFQDRRDPNVRGTTNGLERRQFADGHAGLSPEAAELGRAIDQYKLMNRRRYVSYEEMLAIITDLGYRKA